MGSGRGRSRRAQVIGIEGPVLTIHARNAYFYNHSVYIAEDVPDSFRSRTQGSSLRELLYGAGLVNREVRLTIASGGDLLRSASGLLQEKENLDLHIGDSRMTEVFQGIPGRHVDITVLLLSDARRVDEGRYADVKPVGF